VFGGGFLIPVVELFFVYSLFDKEYVGAQFEQRVELFCRNRGPRFGNHGTFRHK
jgi:hypothetical protein